MLPACTLALAILLFTPRAHANHSESTALPDRIADTLDVLEVSGSIDRSLTRVPSATQGVVSGERLRTRPLARAGDVLEAVPGVVVSQHSGEGKANQYYLRGFNLDHGTDFATSVAGVPANLPTHGHGQGYTDLSFVIPELIRGVQYRKGAFHAEDGDFSSAGSAHIALTDALDRPVLSIAGDGFGYRRALAAGSRAVRGGTLLAALESSRNDGPWDRPDQARRTNGMLRYTSGEAGARWGLTALGYDARWNASDQIPRRAIARGEIGRFGSVNPSDGGTSSRASLSADWLRASESRLTQASVFAMRYSLQLWSDFTYFLDDTVRGDQFEQSDARWVMGARVQHRRRGWWTDREWDALLGVQARHDAIGEVGLHRTESRARHATVRQDRVGLTAVAPYASAELELTPWLRPTLGLRLDHQRARVRSDREVNSGTASATLLSPRIALSLGPWKRVAVFADMARGFHSNDARGATTTLDPATGEPASSVDLLAPTTAADLGLRVAWRNGAISSIALWGLDMDSELLFVGDAGTTEATRPSRRVGVELTQRMPLGRRVALEADLAWSRARFRDAAEEGDRIPGAPEWVAAAGIEARPGSRVSGSLRLRHFGSRPLEESGRVRSAATTTLSTRLGLVIAPSARVEVDVLNLLDAPVSDVDYLYTSRLRGESAPVEDVHSHPAQPFTLRVALRLTGS